MSSTVDITDRSFDWASDAAAARRRRRYAADRRLRFAGIAAIGTAILLLGTLLASIVGAGYQAFVQTHVTMEVTLDPAEIDRAAPFDGDYRAVLADSLQRLFPEVEDRQRRDLSEILSSGSPYIVRDMVVENPDLIGQTISVELPASDIFDQLEKGVISRATPEEFRRVSDQQIDWWDAMRLDGRVSQPLNWGLLFNADSRFPELAGLRGAIIGSFYLVIICFALSFPAGVAAAVYLEEFAPRNRWTDLIEVNINNLAAVPSIVFGLLGLAVFLGWFGLPRSTPLAGGLVLALITLPTIIIVTRAALKAVPPSIREAALSVGASKHEVVLHHVLPLALPGIMTGTILGLAHAFGETAPLLLIGMNAFITSAPGGILDASTALPTQIYIWADSPERGFIARTSAGILVLLGFLMVMNAIAIFLRQRLERSW